MSQPHHRPIPGTQPFDATLAQRGYALNKMCFSFNDAANREAFRDIAERVVETMEGDW